MEGYLWKKGRAEKGFGRRNWKQRWFVLTPQCLECYEAFDLKNNIPCQLKFEVNVFGAEISPTIHHNKEFTFFVRTIDDAVPLYLKADDAFTFNLWMKELLAAVEGKQMLRTLTFNDCLSAICIEKTLDVDAHTLENCYKTRLQNIQLDNASENDKISRAKSITAIYGRLLALYTEREIRRQSETIEYTSTVIKMVNGADGIGVIFQEHPITSAIKVKSVSGTIFLENIDPPVANTIHEGDILLEINGFPVATMNLSLLLQRLGDFRQPLNSKVVLKFCRFVKKIQLRSASPNARPTISQSQSNITPSYATHISEDEHDKENHIDVRRCIQDRDNNPAINSFPRCPEDDCQPSNTIVSAGAEHDRSIVAVIHINNGAKVMDITIRENDDPSLLAQKFVIQHHLNEMLVPMLVKEIEKSLLLTQTPISLDANDTLKIDRVENQNRVPDVSDLRGVPSEISFRRSRSPYGNVEPDFDDSQHDDTMSQSSPLTEEYTHSDYSFGKGSNQIVHSHEILSTPVNVGCEDTPTIISTKNVYDRLYEHASTLHMKKDMLREQLEEERYQGILATSFRAKLWKNGSRNATSHRDERYKCGAAIENDHQNNDLDCSSNSLSSPSSKHDIKVFDRLHGYAEKMRANKETLRKSFEENRAMEIMDASVRTIDKDAKLPLSQAVKLFEDHMAWMKSRDKHITELEKRIKAEKEKSYLKDLTFSPKLVVSKHMSLPRSKSADRIFDHLYDQRNVQDLKRKMLVEKHTIERHEKACFKPKISARSNYLAKRRILNHDTIRNDVNDVSNLRCPALLLNENKEYSPEKSPSHQYLFNAEIPCGHGSDSLDTKSISHKNDYDNPTGATDIDTKVVTLLQSTEVFNCPRDQEQYVKDATEGEPLENVVSAKFHPNLESISVTSPSINISRRSISAPTVKSGAKNVFDRLYQAKDEMKESQQRLAKQLRPEFSHIPLTNVNQSTSEEKTAVDVFEKLYNYRDKRSQESIFARIDHHKQDINESSFTRQNYQGYSSPLKTRAITPTQADALVQRLWNSKSVTDQRLAKKKEQTIDEMSSNMHSSFIRKSSNRYAMSMYEASLSEIFDVLVVSADYYKEHQDSKARRNFPDSCPISVEGVSIKEELLNEHKEEPELSLLYADTSFLEPRALASAISTVLASFCKGPSTDLRATISKTQFVSSTIRMMFEGRCPPIGYILARKIQESKSSEYWKPAKSSELLELEKCSNKPTLLARKKTESLLSERNKDRNDGKISIEDSLISYNLVKQQKLAVMKEQLDKLERAECTFQPSLIASTMKDMSSSQRFRLDKSACEDSVQYFQSMKGDVDAQAIHTTAGPLDYNDLICPTRSKYLLPPYLDDIGR